VSTAPRPGSSATRPGRIWFLTVTANARVDLGALPNRIEQANASAASSTGPSPQTPSSTNSTASPPAAPTRPCCVATTAPNWPARRWPTGPGNASDFPLSRPANPGGTATSNRSTAGSETKPQHQHFLIPHPSPGRHRRLAGQIQPPPQALRPGLSDTGPVRCRLHPPMTDSHKPWISSRGPATGSTPQGPDHNQVMELCRRLAVGEDVRLPEGTAAFMGRPWFT